MKGKNSKAMIVPLTKGWAEAYLPAVNKLIDHYEGVRLVGYCPLCTVANPKWDRLSTCTLCPWLVIEKQFCTQVISGLEINRVREERPAWWCKKALMRLRLWRTIMEGIIFSSKIWRTALAEHQGKGKLK